MMNIERYIRDNRRVQGKVKKACAESSRKIRAEIAGTKKALIAEFRYTIGANDRLIRLVVNEAEALAWQSGYPHLIFPMLAVEKAQAIARWQVRQKAIRSRRTVIAFSA